MSRFRIFLWNEIEDYVKDLLMKYWEGSIDTLYFCLKTWHKYHWRSKLHYTLVKFRNERKKSYHMKHWDLYKQYLLESYYRDIIELK